MDWLPSEHPYQKTYSQKYQNAGYNILAPDLNRDYYSKFSWRSPAEETGAGSLRRPLNGTHRVDQLKSLRRINPNIDNDVPLFAANRTSKSRTHDITPFDVIQASVEKEDRTSFGARKRRIEPMHKEQGIFQREKTKMFSMKLNGLSNDMFKNPKINRRFENTYNSSNQNNIKRNILAPDYPLPEYEPPKYGLHKYKTI